MLIDSHCHLDFPSSSRPPSGRSGLARGAAGVGGWSRSRRASRRPTSIAAIAEDHPQVLFTVGTHPHNAAEEPDVAAEELVALLAAHPRCVAIGEAGLDFHYDTSPATCRSACFATHIAAARESGLPLVIHARDADDDMIRILVEESGRGRFDAVLHCFSSGEDARARRRRSRLLRLVFRHPDLQERRSALRRIIAEVKSRATASSSKPMRPISRPCRIAAGRTSPPTSSHTAAILAETIGMLDRPRSHDLTTATTSTGSSRRPTCPEANQCRSRADPA